MGEICSKDAATATTQKDELVAQGPISTYGKQYKHNVLFLCNHNSCRSQMADGWFRELRTASGKSIGVASAGIAGRTAVKEGAIIVMKEVNIDISNFTSDA